MCLFIKNILFIGPSHIAPCCIGNTFAQPPIYIGKEGLKKNSTDIVSDIFIERGHLYSQYNQSEPCSSCLYKERYSAINNNVQGLIISHSNICQLACKYCYLTKGTYGEVDTAQYNLYELVKMLVDRRMLDKKRYIFWSGGEPLLSSYFEDIITYASQNYFEQYLNTNCLQYSDLSYQLLTSDRHFHLICSVDASTGDTYRKIKGRDVFPMILENISAYIKSRGNVYLKYILLPENIDESEHFIKLFSTMGVKKYFFDFDCDSRNRSEAVWTALGKLLKAVQQVGAQAFYAGHSLPSLNDREKGRLKVTMKNNPAVRLIPYKPFSLCVDGYLLKN